MSDPILWSLRDVRLDGHHRPRLEVPALDIRAGVTAVIGYSGAGKTSLLNLLVGFERPDRGTARASCSYFWVPPNGGLWPHLTAREHLRVASRNAASAEAQRWLSDFDLEDRAEAYPDSLSEGEQSRLAVARALAVPGVSALVMDEPFAHVDPARTGKYWGVIRQHLAARGMALVFSTHTAEAVLGEADRVICLKEGRLLYDGDVRALYWQPENAELAEFLGPVNWLTMEEADFWLGAKAAGCFRPEQVAIFETAGGRFIVLSARFRGAVAEVEVSDPPSGGKRRFYHRPAGDALSAGMRVEARLLC